ncbi:Bifunctional uridylyltransferase/uridylyl-removing enzyme [Gracilariopsis chorda]|uniref:Bifunctional uridylyltransferase/uridylyl-removing enzyme n=1 Tax=Gracilariopsis chorda TaxID=448386 RepID=A0A2V3IG45_9FLOR|nr:Bifunctional uridylyltransferase/uridylyl-removing enzyme [Gracilariopsis chorda]|eukprot:PXF41059.1 Bifunctional uridylyltransferase/uridylyl-removing enzyme [Gracilariopsis chorda]
MAFVTAIPLLPRPLSSRVSPRRPYRMCAQNSIDKVPTPTLSTQIYGPEDDICTFGDECALSEDVVKSSPALDHLVQKYVFPMREHNTQVFFDNSLHDQHTLMIVFAEDRHGLVLDVVSVLKALSVRVHRTTSGENDALRFMLCRIEGELRSVAALGLSLSNCVAFWITDESTGEKIFDDGVRLDQLTTCVKLELNTPYPRPRPAREHSWHRLSIQKNRNDRYSVFSVQTTDRPRLLAELTDAFAAINIDIASATIKTFTERVENTFFVTKRGFKEPLQDTDIKLAMERVLAALLKVGDKQPTETLWYQVRDGTAVIIAEAIFIDEVNNRELAMFRFSQFETPNFRGRLPDAPYRPIIV